MSIHRERPRTDMQSAVSRFGENCKILVWLSFYGTREFLLQSIINKPRRERRRNSETILSLSSLIEFVLNESAIKIEI